MFYDKMRYFLFHSASDRDALIRQMVNDLDADGDGFVTENELHSEFVISMDTNSSKFVNPI